MFKQKKVVASFFSFLLLGMLVFGADPSRKIIINAAPTGKEPLPYAENEVLVKFKPGVSLNSINQLAIQKAMIVKKHFRILSRLTGYEYVLLKSSDLSTVDMVNDLALNSAVESVSPNYRNYLDATPNDTRYSELWGMNNTGQTGGATDADIDAPAAWDYNTGSSSTIVAVVDTGLDYTHPDLATNAWVNAAEYSGTAGVDDDANGYIDDIYGIDPAGFDGSHPDSDPRDGYGHGTHCAGTIGAVGNNSLGVVGVNWNVKIMGLKFFDDAGGNGYNSFAIECIEYAIDQKINYSQNVVAINASWGNYSFDQTLKDAIEAAGDEGIVFCAAAGNDTTNNDTNPHYPSSFDSSNIIAVAATDHNDLIASFSNYGATTVDLGAPGASILSTVPAVYVPQSGDIFFDNMEGGAGNWVHGGTLDTWAISENQEGFANPSFPVPSPTHFWSDSPGVNYSAGTNSWLALGSDIDLSSYVGQDLYLGIGSAMYIENYWDHGYVELSNDSGASWTPIFDFSGYGYYWSQWSWLIPDSFKTSHFRVRFHFTSDGSVQIWGWLIDNVGIGTTVTYGYESWGGTSMATPHVAGAVALMAAEYPAEGLTDRINRILDNVDSLASLSGLCVTGGRLNLYNSISATTTDSVTVTSPDGGENWTVGAGQTISWSSTGSIANVRIEYSTNSGSSWSDVIASTPNDGSHSWTIPDTPSTTCLVRVSDAANAATNDVSNAVFTISASTASITVTAPDGGESWGTCSSQTITWTSTGFISNVAIDFSPNGGSVWMTLTSSTANDGSFDWDVPNNPSTNCLIRISDAADGTPADQSNGSFTILLIPNEWSGMTSRSHPVSFNVSLDFSQWDTFALTTDFDDGGTTGEFTTTVGGPGSIVGNQFSYTSSTYSFTGTFTSTTTATGTYSFNNYRISIPIPTPPYYYYYYLTQSGTWTATKSSGCSALPMFYNSPSDRLILTEVNWAPASGGGDWVSEVQIIDISGGSVVQVYFNSGTTRHGPFTLWTNSGGANCSAKFANILSTIDGLDGTSFVYYGTSGALEFVTQDTTHLIQASVRTYNGNYTRTFPALADGETNTAAVGRNIMIPNISNNSSYRPSVVFFNPGSDSVTTDVKIIGSDGVQVGSTISRTLAGYEMNVITSEVRADTYSNAMILITPISGSGRIIASGQTANNVTNDPAAHLAVQTGSGYANSPSQTKVLTEVNWAAASGGGEWVSEVEIVDITGGSTVQVIYDNGTNRRGPFTLWTNSGGANRSMTYANILQTLSGLDSGFTYFGTSGALQFTTQDGSHLIQAAVRTYNGNFSRTFPALGEHEANTAASGRVMVVPNICNNATYRPSLVLYNPSDTSATVEVKIVGGDGVQIGSTISRTLAAHEMNVITSEVRANTYDNAFLRVEVTSGTSWILLSGQSANNVTNDPAAHVAVQGQ